jgi:poly-gamma-glutamate capsule biosynthesis protein CapA/YwtB (metallophosphatase superfamily)
MRPTLPPLDPADVQVSFVGDVMMFDGGWSTFADPVSDRFAELAVGNLETPVAASHPDVRDRAALADAGGLYAFNSPEELLDGLPLDLVQVNNNHSLDLGDGALEETVDALTARGLVPIGMDEHRAFADPGDVALAFLSYTWGTNAHPDSVHDLHVVPFGHPEVDLRGIGRDVDAARADGATHVVLLLHWGYEYEYYPDPHFLQLGRRLVELGADLVVGSGPHAVEPAEICEVNRPIAVPSIGRCSVRTEDGRPRTAAILYSLGDFGTLLTSPPLEVGLVATVSFRPGLGVSGLGWDPVATVDLGEDRQVVPLSALTEDDAYAAEEARLDALLGTTWKR